MISLKTTVLSSTKALFERLGQQRSQERRRGARSSADSACCLPHGRSTLALLAVSERDRNKSSH